MPTRVRLTRTMLFEVGPTVHVVLEGTTGDLSAIEGSDRLPLMRVSFPALAKGQAETVAIDVLVNPDDLAIADGQHGKRR